MCGHRARASARRAADAPGRAARGRTPPGDGAPRGNASFSYNADPQGKALIIAVSCLGAGTIKVAVPVLGTDFPLECGTAEPAVMYNQLAMQAAHRAGTVTVTAPSTATWAITVGRGNTAEQEPPTPG